MTIDILQQAIASLYKRKNKDVLKEKELELLASMELRWFEPAEARKIVNLALKLGLLSQTSTGLKPSFNHKSIEIPLGFKPPKDLLTNLEQENESLFMQIVNQICLSTGLEQQQVIAEINSRQEKLQGFVTLEVIAILYGKEKAVDVDRFIPDVENKLLARTK